MTNDAHHLCTGLAEQQCCSLVPGQRGCELLFKAEDVDTTPGAWVGDLSKPKWEMLRESLSRDHHLCSQVREAPQRVSCSIMKAVTNCSL